MCLEIVFSKPHGCSLLKPIAAKGRLTSSRNLPENVAHAAALQIRGFKYTSRALLSLSYSVASRLSLSLSTETSLINFVRLSLLNKFVNVLPSFISL